MLSQPISVSALAARAVIAQLSDPSLQTFGRLGRSLADTAQRGLAMLPSIIAALLVLAVGLLVSRRLARATIAWSQRVGLHEAARRVGLVELLPRVGIHRSVPQVAGSLVFWLLMAAALILACHLLGLPAVASALQGLAIYLPKLLVAGMLIALGLSVATFVRGWIASSAERAGLATAHELAVGGYYLLLAIFVIAALDQLGIALRLLNAALLILLAAAALAAALAAGLGARDLVAGLLAGYLLRRRLQAGDLVAIGQLRGRVREVGPLATIVETEEEGLTHRHSVPNARMLNEAVR
jgi:small-conductance mechanosensitive channel